MRAGKQIRRWMVLGAIALAAGVGGVFGVANFVGSARSSAPAAAQVEAPVRPVRAIQVRFEDGAARFDLPGVIAPRVDALLAFRVAGKVVERSVDVGAAVRPGQVLARLDQADYRLQVQNARAQLLSAEADLARAQADLDRYEGLRSSPAYNSQVFDQRRAAFGTARERANAARSQLALAQNNLQYTALVATAAGVVTQTLAEPGQVVAAGAGIVRVAQTDELEVQVAVPENRLADLRAATTVEFSLWATPDRRGAATLRELSPQADAMTRTYAARFAVAETGLAMGQTATLHVQKGQGAQVAALPLTALRDRAGQPAVWVVLDGRPVLRPVVVAGYRDDAVLVAGGLAANEWVVTAGVQTLDPAMRVRVLGQR